MTDGTLLTDRARPAVRFERHLPRARFERSRQLSNPSSARRTVLQQATRTGTKGEKAHDEASDGNA
jgi:hypothetical protein